MHNAWKLARKVRSPTPWIKSQRRVAPQSPWTRQIRQIPGHVNASRFSGRILRKVIQHFEEATYVGVGRRPHKIRIHIPPEE